MLRAFRAWRRERILGRSTLDESSWRAVTGRYSFMRALAPEDRARLRELVILFLHEKSVVGAAVSINRCSLPLMPISRACFAENLFHI